MLGKLAAGAQISVCVQLVSRLLTVSRAHYLGYSSDICRSFFIDPPKPNGHWRPGCINSWLEAAGLRRQHHHHDHDHDHRQHRNHENSELRSEKLKVWDIVLDAQTAAAGAFKPNGTAAGVDIAARTVIEDAGYGYGFTHRLGHGISIKGMLASVSSIQDISGSTD